MASSDFTFYTSAEYWKELLEQIAHTKHGDRIAVMVMSFEPKEPITDRVIYELLAAAKRGVEVYLSVDAYNFIFHSDRNILGPLWWRTSLHPTTKLFKEKLHPLELLQQQPTGHVVITNKPKRAFGIPPSGRVHIKYTVINNQVFVGGCNLHNTHWLDLMVRWHDKHIADYLFHFTQDIHRTESTKLLMDGHDREIIIDPKTMLYIDAGQKNQSLIFEKALELIDSAEKSLVITCQYFPNSVTAQHITAAYRRGVDVEVIYAHPSMQGGIGGFGQHISILRERLRVPAELFSKRLPKDAPGLHAKLIATEKGAIVGSHNYVRAGVMLGTAEIALLRYDPTFVKQSLHALRKMLTP